MSEARRYAILIGSSRFDNEPKLNPLKCPERDVDGMREILAAPELGAFGEPFVFKDVENHAVLRRIEEVLSDANHDDQVLIYYSGHGATDLPGRLYLATANTEVKSLVSTSIPVEMLRLFIENSACRKIILILDCCYGGAAGKSFSRGVVDEKLKELARGSGVYILTASTASQTEKEREGDDYGLLTKHIIAGIKQGEADINEDGVVSMDDLYGYVFAKVKSEGCQEPMRWALNVKGEDLIIARASAARGRERQRLLSEKINEARDSLPRQIFLRALQVIDEPRSPFYGLIEDVFHRRLQIGEFIEEWRRAESVESMQQAAPVSSEPTAQPDAPANTESETPFRGPETQSQRESHSLPVAPSTTARSEAIRKPRSADSQTSPYAYRRKRGLIMAVSSIALAIAALFTWLALKSTNNTKSAPLGSLAPTLSSVGFETITLDAQGNEISRRALQADSVAEDLGDGVTLEMIKIPAGEFQMGSTEDEAKVAFANARKYFKEATWVAIKVEMPRHRVQVAEFSIGRFEVTRDQWRQVARMPKVKIDLNQDPANFKDSWKLPVEQVSWEDAVEFCERLKQKTGKAYRLPTEAEWEYAARAGTTSTFAFGPTISPRIVNYDGKYPYGSAEKGVYRNKTVEVGSLGFANAFGLFDMQGNVWEWCEDVRYNGYTGAPADGSAWTNSGNQSMRVLRSGAWNNTARYCRSACRNLNRPDHRFYDIGFRVVVVSRIP